MPGFDSSALGLGPIHHLGYVVEDIRSTARQLHEAFGAGPLFYLEEVPVADVTSRGEPAEFMHDSAFGMLNGGVVELMKITRLSPARAEARFDRPEERWLHHVAYAVPVPELAAIRARLDEHGIPEYLNAHFGEDVDFTYHDGSGVLGHDFEIHADSDGLRGFFSMFPEAAAGWDGSDLLRSPG
jgi:methylmalonyl-CoA/ethylmalonyl-CoA epimerase